MSKYILSFAFILYFSPSNNLYASEKTTLIVCECAKKVFTEFQDSSPATITDPAYPGVTLSDQEINLHTLMQRITTTKDEQLAIIDHITPWKEEIRELRILEHLLEGKRAKELRRLHRIIIENHFPRRYCYDGYREYAFNKFMSSPNSKTFRLIRKRICRKIGFQYWKIESLKGYQSQLEDLEATLREQIGWPEKDDLISLLTQRRNSAEDGYAELPDDETIKTILSAYFYI